MSMQYANPPIKEAVCEFRFGSSIKYSDEKLQLLADSVKGTFPERKEGKNVTVNVNIPNQNEGQQEGDAVQQSVDSFVRLVNEEKNLGFHIRKDGVISIHKVGAYESWGTFLPVITEAFNNFVRVFEPENVVRIGVRYINEIKIPKDGYVNEDYFNYDLNFAIEDSLVSQNLSVLFSSNNNRDNARVQLIEVTNNKHKDKTFVFDLDYYLSDPSTFSIGDSIDWVDQAHTNLEGYFESILSKKTKDLFN